VDINTQPNRAPRQPVVRGSVTHPRTRRGLYFDDTVQLLAMVLIVPIPSESVRILNDGEPGDGNATQVATCQIEVMSGKPLVQSASLSSEAVAPAPAFKVELVGPSDGLQLPMLLQVETDGILLHDLASGRY
jgi:hypothetical protein